MSSSPKLESGGCRLHGAAAVMLRMSRACGAAPVAFQRQPNAFIAYYSRKHARITNVFALLMCVLILIAVKIDVSSEIWNSIHYNYKVLRLTLNCINYVMTSIIVITSTVRGPAAVDRFLSQYTQIQKVYESFEDKPTSRKLEKMLRVMLAGSTTIVIASCIANAILSTREVLLLDTDWTLHIITKLLYVGYMISFLIGLQIAFRVTFALWTLKALNKSIMGLQKRIKQGSREVDSALICRIRRLSNSYATVFDVCEQINGMDGSMMLLLLADCTYRILVYVFFVKLSTHITDTKGWVYALIAAQTTHFFRVCLLIVMLVQPCLLTHKEFRRSKELISEALCAPRSALEEVSTVLTRFYSAVEPFGRVYTPMGTFHFSSSLYIALLGGLTTLITIIVNI